VTAIEVEAHAATAGTAQRRRGAELEDAIREAAFAELTAVGYTALTVEGVAARARTGKASIYRRWPTKQDLVMDAMCAVLPTPEDCGVGMRVDDSVSTADALRQLARALTGIMRSPAGEAMRSIKCEAATDVQLAELIRERFEKPRRAALLGLLTRGVARGEVRPDAAVPLVADVLPAMVMHRVIGQRAPITERAITEIVDQVLLPLVEARQVVPAVVDAR
jgi:AcrR family transcriptional regulator